MYPPVVPLASYPERYRLGLDPVTGPTMALLSDVVALRPLPFREETTALISALSPKDAESLSQIVPDRSKNEMLVIISQDNHWHEHMLLTSSEVKILRLRESGDQWTTVNHRRRVRSLGSMERTRNASKESVHIVHVPTKENE
jgi:hypothetical protein